VYITTRPQTEVAFSEGGMSESQPDETAQHKEYQIRIRGHLSQQWSEWFQGLAITLDESGDTILTGTIVDQSALHGLLKRVRDLGLPLISVNRIEAGVIRQASSPPDEKRSSDQGSSEEVQDRE
jgi:hypothetical protein